MLFGFVKQLSDKFGSIDVKDCVVAIPLYYSAAQRIALANAVKISGLVLLGFIQEPSAAALYHSINRSD